MKRVLYYFKMAPRFHTNDSCVNTPANFQMQGRLCQSLLKVSFHKGAEYVDLHVHLLANKYQMPSGNENANYCLCRLYRVTVLFHILTISTHVSLLKCVW